VAFTVVACDDGEVRKLGGGLTTVACVAYRVVLSILSSSLATSDLTSFSSFTMVPR